MDLPEISKLPAHWIVVLWVADKALEYWLGKTNKVQAGSVVELVTNTLHRKEVKMEKSFDMKNLTERLKAKGLDATEELVKILVGETLDWTSESLTIHPNAFVKYLVPAIGTVKPLIMNEVDKIDGQVG